MGELEIDEGFHLVGELFAVAVPPQLFHAREAVGVEVFYAHHFFQAELTVRTADAAGLEASVGSFADAEARDHVIHHDGSGVDLAGNCFSALLVTRPNAGREPELGIIHETDRFRIGGEGRDRQHGPEGFFAHDSHLVRDIGEDGGRVEMWAEFGQARTSGEDADALGASFLHLCLDDAQLALVDHRADVGLRIHAVAEAQFLRLRDTGVQEFFVKRLVDVTSLDREAGLAGIDEGAPNGCARGDIEVGIVEHEHRIFASEFQHDRQEAGGGSLRDPFAGWNTASEDELVDFGVEKRGTGCTVAHNYLEDFFRNSGRVQEACQLHRDQRCEFRGLQHHRISSDHSGQRVDGGNGQRIVPGGNNGNHAVGVAQDAPFFRLHGNAAVRDRLFAEKCEGVVDEETGGVEDDQDFGQQGFYVRLAGFLRDESSDFGFVFVLELLKFSDDANALFDAERGPCGLRGAGLGYGDVHFGIGGAIQLSQ